jgi:hypothetical protein
MIILTYFTENNIPKTGLSPTIRIRNASTGILIITDELMSEVGDGFYKYEFVGYDSSIDYAIRCDGGMSLSNDERYSYAGNDVDQTEEIWSNTIRTLTSGTKDSEIDAIKERTDNLPDDPASESGALAKDSTVAKEATLNDKASQSSVNAIKSDTESIITTLSTLVVDVWSYTTRTLTSFGTLVADIWSYITRTITSGGITAAEVWTYITRTLTSGTKDSEIDAIKTQTDKIPRILGLNMENHRIFSPTYDANNCLTSATIKIYPTKADCIADTNSIAIYAMVATFDVDGKCLTYRMTKE